MTAPAVSIVVANWNTCRLLDDLLASVQRTASRIPCETIVIDNGSADGSPSMVEHKYPWVKLIRNRENRGYAEANNQGFAAAHAEHVLLLGSDTVLQDGAVETLARFLDTHPDAGAAACRLLNPDGSPQASCKRFPKLRDGVWTYLSLHCLAGDYNMRGFDFHRTQPVDQPAGTCLMIRKSILTSLGGFDERYRILYNDVDLCRRIRSAGWQLYFVADAQITHYGSVTTRSAPATVRLEMYRNILLYYRAHFGPLADLLLRPILFVRLFAVTRDRVAFQILSSREQRP